MMWSWRAIPINKHANSSAPSNDSFDSTAQGCNHTRRPLTRKPGATSSIEKRVTRRSKGARFVFLRWRLRESPALELKPILFHPSVQGAAAQTQCFGCLAHVALKALERLAN